MKLKLENCKLVISKSDLIDCPGVVATGLSRKRGTACALGCWLPRTNAAEAIAPAGSRECSLGKREIGFKGA